MATLLLAAAGSAVGGLLGGVGAVVGQAVGGIAGALIDRSLLRSGRSVDGPRLTDLDVQSSTEGNAIPRVYGRVRLSGQVIWATRHEETAVSTNSGGKGGTSSTSYKYHANFAVALCEGPIHRISRVWADGTLIDLANVTCRIYMGDEDQEPDPLILARQGSVAPAYRGTAYVVFERLPLDDWGNRIPQLAFEVIRAVDTLESKVEAVCLIPGSTEFGYATTAVTRLSGGSTASENRHVTSAATDFLAALDELVEICPDLKRVALVVAWFGDDLRAGDCRLRPAVDAAVKTTAPLVWSVAGLTRDEARLVATVSGRAAYGGTPSDEVVIAAVREIRARGLEAMLYPFVAMDIPAGNGRPDPWSGGEQGAFPWRGRITCHPAAGRIGSADRTAAARTQIAAFVGTAAPGHFAVSGDRVVYSGPAEWSLRRMVLHYARLMVAAGGVDAFLLGSELVGLTAVRDDTGAYPFVAALVALAADVRSVLGAGPKISYGADWSEWFGHHPADGTGDVRFHLDPLWASPAIDFVGIDAYWPLSDWRPGDHLDRALADLPTDPAYLRDRVASGENFDWWYASDAARRAQIRSPITDGAHGEPWVYRPKDLVGWWSNAHHERIAGVRAATPTAWVPRSKPIWLTELGCPAVDLGANEPNLFPDPKSAENGLPHFSSGARDDLAQRRLIEATIDHFAAGGAANPTSPLYGGPMLPSRGIQLWAWDARPFPAFPMASDVWSDADAWATGHWLGGRLGGLSIEGLIRAVLADVGFDTVEFRAVAGHVDGFVVDRRMSTREALDPLLAAACVDAIDTGTTLRFAGRARRTDLTLGVDDLVERGRSPLIETRRRQESELPAEIALTFSDALLDHRRTTVSTRRRTGGSRRASSADLALVAPIPAMIGFADGWLADLWSGRTSAEFALAPTAIAIEPGDVVDLGLDDRVVRLMVEGLTDGAARVVEARTLDPDAYRIGRTVGRVRSGTLAPVRAAPIVHALDIAHAGLDDGVYAPYLAAAAEPWPGLLAVWRRLDGTGYSHVASIAAPSTLGVTATALSRGPVALWDRAATVDVTLSSGTLSAPGEARTLDGAGRAAVRAPSGSWEVFQFAAADLVAPATWRLSMLLRAQGGSEDAWDGLGSIPAGSPFVLLDERLVVLPISRDDLGRALDLRIGPAAEPYTAASYVDLTVTPGGRGLLPWSPAHLRAEVDAASGDLRVTWVRRSRAPGADTWALVEVPLAETREAYRLTLSVADATVATVDTAEPAWVWPGADRLARLGSGPAVVTIAVAELSAEIGPGVPRTLVVGL